MMSSNKLYSFLDNRDGQLIHLLEASQLLKELCSMHNIPESNAQYFKEAILSTQPLIAFLKLNEGLGIYFDSENPYFRFKIETNGLGNMRALLLPENFTDVPHRITGVCRISKILPQNKSYTSVIQYAQKTFREIINQILLESYQIEGEILPLPDHGASLFISRLPNVGGFASNHQGPLPTAKEYLFKHQKELVAPLLKTPFSEEYLFEQYKKLGLDPIGPKSVKFVCNCSKMRMLDGVRSVLTRTPLEELFPPGGGPLEIKCDYCKKVYHLAPEDLTTYH